MYMYIHIQMPLILGMCNTVRQANSLLLPCWLGYQELVVKQEEKLVMQLQVLHVLQRKGNSKSVIHHVSDATQLL